VGPSAVVPESCYMANSDVDIEHLDHNSGQRGATEVHALVRRSTGAGSGAIRVARLRYFAAVPGLSVRDPGPSSHSGRHELDPRTYSFNVNGGDCCRIVRDKADHLGILRTVTAG
jgi:hypothetical protein